MGPFNNTQLSISPIFYFCFMDLWGPLTTYCSGYKKKTRAREQKYELHMLVLGCAGTGTINCQIIEKNNTGAIFDGLSSSMKSVSPRYATQIKMEQ